MAGYCYLVERICINYIRSLAGFLADRILVHNRLCWRCSTNAILDAVHKRSLETGIGTKEGWTLVTAIIRELTVLDIDNIMKNGANVPMGPLTLADFIGLVC